MPSPLSPLARELNSLLEKEAPAVLAMLSGLGKRLYFPRGIIGQSQEAKEKGKRFNATIGIATEGGAPMHLPSLGRLFAMEPAEVFSYAPTAGRADLRQLWRAKQLEENPSMRGKAIGAPIVTSALTHGLALAGDLFVDDGDAIVIPEHYWGNYNLTFGVRLGAKLETFPLYDRGEFNCAGFDAKLREVAGARAKAIVLLNFPNNPTGYTPKPEHAERIRDAIVSAAQRGLRQVVLCDDAYFGLVYDEECLQESIFGYLAGVHPNVLAVKLDGATKEVFAWGFRVGFLSFAAAGAGDLEAVHGALEKKAMGAIRGAISNSPNVSQSAVARMLRSQTLASERQAKREVLAARARRTREVAAAPRYREAWDVYPFNSGYFMCIRLKGVDAEALRLHLLERHGTGVIASSAADVRIAFSCLEVDQIEALFDTVHAAWKELKAAPTQ
jgi:aspartate/methionine/tyrosine aminotransferase